MITMASGTAVNCGADGCDVLWENRNMSTLGISENNVSVFELLSATNQWNRHHGSLPTNPKSSNGMKPPAKDQRGSYHRQTRVSDLPPPLHVSLIGEWEDPTARHQIEPTSPFMETHGLQLHISEPWFRKQKVPTPPVSARSLELESDSTSQLSKLRSCESLPAISSRGSKPKLRDRARVRATERTRDIDIEKVNGRSIDGNVDRSFTVSRYARKYLYGPRKPDPKLRLPPLPSDPKPKKSQSNESLELATDVYIAQGESSRLQQTKSMSLRDLTTDYIENTSKLSNFKEDKKFQEKMKVEVIDSSSYDIFARKPTRNKPLNTFAASSKSSTAKHSKCVDNEIYRNDCEEDLNPGFEGVKPADLVQNEGNTKCSEDTCSENNV